MPSTSKEAKIIQIDSVKQNQHVALKVVKNLLLKAAEKPLMFAVPKIRITFDLLKFVKIQCKNLTMQDYFFSFTFNILC